MSTTSRNRIALGEPLPGGQQQQAHSPASALSIADVQRESNLGRTTIYNAIKAGTLVARKAGRRTVILRADFERFLQSLPKIGESP
jgi:hypothetical protein